VKSLSIGMALSIVMAACGGSTPSGTTQTTVAPPVTTSSSTQPPASTTTVAPTTTAAVNTRYTSVFDMRDLVESMGYMCSGWELIAEPLYATERATCTDEVGLAIHANASEAQLSVDTIVGLHAALGLPTVVLVGPNWSVNCSDDEGLCVDFQKVLGGEVQVVTP